MFGLPASTEIRKPVPKTVIYEKFAAEFSGNRKKSFENDVSRILVVNEISSVSVTIREGEVVKSIFAVLVELKNRDYDERNITLIAKLFGQKLLLILHYEDAYQLGIYQTKILHSEWIAESDRVLRLEGLDLDGVWKSLVSQVSGIIPKNEHTLDEQIAIEAEKEKLKKEITRLEAQTRREPQSKKKYELHEKLLAYKKKLEEM
ncbi:MAG: DUF4391 domain-containing protein [Lachnospiraceae bacterium]|nr:DUF4391 domain-containing protein [Lachnospiraceae bacterium]